VKELKVLVIDDERSARRSLERLLRKLPFVVLAEAASLAEARAQLAAGDVDVALIDLRLSASAQSRDGLTLVSEVRQANAVAIVVSGFQDLAEVRAAMRLGAHDYILKDELSEELVLPLLESLHSRRGLEQEVLRLRARRDVPSCPQLVGTSPAMQRLRSEVERVALSERPVLVQGPTGSGKELVVRALHALSESADQPLLDLNCGALPPGLIESQLFGHERGAFTGADRRHTGFFAAVHSGTLFLDEIAELPLELQAKLLRVLETRLFRPLGATMPERFSGRIVAATHADLEERVRAGTFREDLYYRLNVLEVRVPGLEDRREDIPGLVAHFAAMQPRPLAFTEEALQALRQAPWPGNVRQLRNLIDRLAVFAPEGVVTWEILERHGRAPPRRDLHKLVNELACAILELPQTDKLAAAEAALIETAMRRADGNKRAAARLLGVHRKVVERRTGRDEACGATESCEEGHERQPQVLLGASEVHLHRRSNGHG
jgi:DNA-binding NtrC family response regulator